jgi:hypothetical protein
MKFNIGQEVAVIDMRSSSFRKKGMVVNYFCKIDDATEVKIGADIHAFPNHQLAPANTLEGLVPGDVVLDEDDEERTVIERLSRSVLLSDLGERDTAFCWYTLTDLQELGYTIKSTTKEEHKDFPQLHDTFYFIRSRGCVTLSIWTGSYKQRELKEYGNVFKTEAEAKDQNKTN